MLRTLYSLQYKYVIAGSASKKENKLFALLQLVSIGIDFCHKTLNNTSEQPDTVTPAPTDEEHLQSLQDPTAQPRQISTPELCEEEKTTPQVTMDAINTEKPTLEERFQAAVTVVQNMPKDGPVATSVDQKLGFYALYKQATIGPCNVGRPNFWNVVEKYKWDAWLNLANMSQDEAKEEYLRKLNQKINAVNQAHNTKEWLQGDIYEFMKPHFAVLGYNDSMANDTESNNENSDTEVIASDEMDLKAESTVISEGANLISSDGEYCDALEEDERVSRWQSCSYDMDNSTRPHRSRRSPTNERLENEIKKLSTQISTLGTTIESYNTSLMNTLKQATALTMVPNRQVSWRTVLFFIFWPFIAKFLIRYFRKYLKLILH